MRIKLLMVGADPVSLMTDAQLLRERGMLAITAFNTQNINEMVNEVKPDIVFFDPHQPNNAVTDTYNLFVANARFTKIPVIFTLADDDIYLVTRERTATDERAMVADNIIDAVRMALNDKQVTMQKNNVKIHNRSGCVPNVRVGQLFA